MKIKDYKLKENTSIEEVNKENFVLYKKEETVKEVKLTKHGYLNLSLKKFVKNKSGIVSFIILSIIFIYSLLTICFSPFMKVDKLEYGNDGFKLANLKPRITEHYQGGLHLLPVFYSKDRKVFFKTNTMKVSSLNWYNTVIRIEGTNINEISEYCKKLFHTWINYDDEEVDVISHTGTTRHSTITPIARKVDNKYQINLILRNNRCNEQYPDGIFHAHKEYHHIKQEGIGLIEAMGLFILPPRLKRQMSYVEEILTSSTNMKEYLAKYEELSIHEDMIKTLINQHGQNLTKEKAHEVVNDYLATTCKNILCNTAVFKADEKGLNALDKFMEKVGE